MYYHEPENDWKPVAAIVLGILILYAVAREGDTKACAASPDYCDYGEYVPTRADPHISLREAMRKDVGLPKW